ncbi:MAG TPA: S8 family serine peptidase, partial [Flavisolibacter sp.]
MFRHLFLLLTLSCALNAGAQKPVNGNTKLSSTLRQALERKGAKDSIDLILSLSPATGISSIQRSARIIYIHPSSHTVVARMSREDIERVAAGPEVLFAGAYIQPKEELNSGINDLTLNKVNYVHDRFPFLDGSTLSVTIKERAFDSTDIDLKGRVFKTLLENPVNTSHASLMATIVAGAANSSYFARGVASGARTGSTSFANLLPETDSFFRKHGISVQNHSYGTIVENFYGSDAAAYDQSAVNNPGLLHVFSSGNSGNANGTGPYTGITGYANLTGNAKHAKNVLVAGATDSITQVEALSSKGPAHDGRIKPELVAFGQEGSSGAAAMVSGGALLVQHAYSRMQGSVPSSSLVKAALINGADEAGAPHPDYFSGYGSLNAYRAVEAIMQSRFHQSSLVQDEVRSFSLNIPSGISRLKLTLVWTDPAAAPNAARALVNDLDLVLRNPSSGQAWLPWGLSHAAHKDSLQLPARRQRDSLNNVEQVSIDAPAAGNYIIEVKGAKLGTASQAFSLVYQLDTAGRFTWTYPMATDPLVAGTTQILRWETTRTGTGVLEYSFDGATWKPIGNITNLSTNYYKWAVPDTLALARLRMRTGLTEAL